ncbi:MATE family efflux transporter [Oscillibacter sp.]|uniref:MATE family efflux transporter n=1 Tax=Oscillibacter sp. TaxID=1945593 RepID=UPI0033987738
MNQCQNKMGILPIPRLLIQMGAPMMLSMLVQALYNVVDTLFVSHMSDTAAISQIGDKAVTALTLAFPVQMLIMALCVGTGVGVNAVVSRSLGQKNREKAALVAGNSILLSLIYYVAVFIFGLFLARKFLQTQTSDPDVLKMGIDYLQTVTVFSFGSIFYMCFEKLLQATGKTTGAMLGQLVGSVANIVLDPILIFGYWGAPALGVKGAAIATVLGQCLSLAVVLSLHITKNNEICKGTCYLKPSLSILGQIYAVGAPAILMQALTSVMTYGMNLILGTISTSAITAYGVYYKLQNFVFMPAFGLNNASIPIVSYNYGAKQMPRVKQAIFYGLALAGCILGAGIVILQVFATPLVQCFSISDESVALCIRALRIITCGFLFAGCNIILQGICQALGNGIYSLIISMLRMIVITLPLAWLLSMTEAAAQIVWVALPCAELCAMLAAVFLSVRLYKNKVAALSQTEKNEVETIEAILSRQSVREFSEKEISESDLQAILSAGMSGPSCVNARDWSFLVVRNHDMLCQMADANGAPAAPLKKAAAGILVCGDLERAFPPAKEYWVIDGAIALQNMTLAAHALGIGSVCLGTWPQMDRVQCQQKLFSLPETIIPHSILALGYPAKAAAPVPNRYEADRVHFEKW